MEQSELTYIGSEITDSEILDGVPEGYRRLLNQTNGFILFDGGLHVRGAVLSPDWHSLRKVWLGDLALHKLFSAIEESDLPFAQDCLGDQFVLRGGVVHKLNAEEGELTSLNLDLTTFLSKAEEDPVGFLSLQPLLRFYNEGGRLEQGQLLNVYPPFCSEESAQDVSIRAVPMFERLGFLSKLAAFIGSIGKGQKFRINVTR
jgi:hypothetical protein